MKFLFDEHTPPQLVRALAELARNEPYQIIHHRDRFPRGTKDVDWLGALGAEGGWRFVSEDRRIRQRPQELVALRQARLIGFFLAKGWNQTELWERASLLIAWWPTIAAAGVSASPGQCFMVPFARPTGARELKPMIDG